MLYEVLYTSYIDFCGQEGAWIPILNLLKKILLYRNFDFHTLHSKMYSCDDL